MGQHNETGGTRNFCPVSKERYDKAGLTKCFSISNIQDTSVGVSVFTLTALSLDRYTAIVRPVQSFTNGHRSRLDVMTSLAIIWAISLLLALPAALFSYLKALPVPAGPFAVRNVTICYPFPEEFGRGYAKFIVISRFMVHYCLPLIIIGTFYLIMARYLLQRQI